MLTTPVGPDTEAKARWPLVLVFIAALVVRLALLAAGPWSEPERAIMPDSGRYLLLADNLRDYGKFGKADEEGSPWTQVAAIRARNGTLPPTDANGLRPESMRTPGYPAFLRLAQFAGGGTRIVLVVQSLLGALGACALVGIAEAVGLSRARSLAVGWVWALHPGVLIRDLVVLTESTYLSCTVFALWFASRRERWSGGVLSGLLLGASGLIRPMVGFLALPALLALIAKRNAKPIQAAALAILGCFAPSAAWVVRNQAVGEGARFSSLGDLTLLYHGAGYTISEERGEDWIKTWPDRIAELSERLEARVRPGDDVITAARRMAVEEIRARPVPFARVLVKSQVKLFLSHSLSDFYQVLGRPYRPSGLFSRWVLRESEEGEGSLWGVFFALAWVGLNGAIAMLALVGTVGAVRRRDLVLVACALWVALVAAGTLSNGLERLRMGMVVPLLLLAASAHLRRTGPAADT